MRPRGESISTPSSRYVGHAFRHKPQCTQRSRSTCCGLSSWLSDSTKETSNVEKTFRIKHVLDLFHDRKVAAATRPQVERGLCILARAFDNTLPAARTAGRQPPGR